MNNNIHVMAVGIQQVPLKSLNHNNSNYSHKYSSMVKIILAMDLLGFGF